MLAPIPAGERLECDEPTRAEVDDRLEVDVDLPSIDCPLERCRELLPPPNLRVHLRRVDRVATLAALLRVVHRHVRVPQQLVRGQGTLAAVRDSDARVHGDLATVDAERLFERFHEPLGDALGLLHRRRYGQRYRSLRRARKGR